MTDVMIPTIHLNGTSIRDIEGQLNDAVQAVRAAKEALGRAAPNVRDYYPQGPSAIHMAVAQHVARLKRLEDVEQELRAIWEGLPVNLTN